MRTTYKSVKFKCTKCENINEVLHDISTPAPNPKCPNCSADTEVVELTNEFGTCNIAFKGLTTPGSSMPKQLKDQWLNRRVEQVKRTGK